MNWIDLDWLPMNEGSLNGWMKQKNTKFVWKPW